MSMTDARKKASLERMRESGRALVVSMRGDDIALFADAMAAVEARAGVQVTHSALVRAALRALLEKQQVWSGS
jgi:hypothetical protein